MDLGIRGRKAIVNGGSAGMGRGSVLALANEGVELYVSARGEERLINACAEIARQTGANITPIVADHSTDEGRERILAACPEPDILVGTCAPPATTGDYRTVSVDDWNENLAITLLSPVQFMQATIDGMVERGWGRIVNIATGAAKFPTQIRILSGAPRAALVNYTVAVSKVVAKHNVMINNILPGMHHTAAIRDRYTAAAAANGTTFTMRKCRSSSRRGEFRPKNLAMPMIWARLSPCSAASSQATSLGRTWSLTAVSATRPSNRRNVVSRPAKDQGFFTVPWQLLQPVLACG